MSVKKIVAVLVCSSMILSQTVCAFASAEPSQDLGSDAKADAISVDKNEGTGAAQPGQADPAQEQTSGQPKSDQAQDDGAQAQTSQSQDGGDQLSQSESQQAQDGGEQSTQAQTGQSQDGVDQLPQSESQQTQDNEQQSQTAGKSNDASQPTGEAQNEGQADVQQSADESNETQKTAKDNGQPGVNASEGTENAGNTGNKDTSNAGNKSGSDKTGAAATDKNTNTAASDNKDNKNSVSSDTVSGDGVSANLISKAKKGESDDGKDTGWAEVYEITGDPKGYPYVAPAADPYQAMIALQSQYPERRHWTDDDRYTSKGRLYNNGHFSTLTGTGCEGFALILSDAAFGSLPIVQHTNFSDIHVGDIIRLTNSYGGEHSVIILELRGNTIVTAEGNYNESIHWGREFNRNNTSGWKYIETRKKVDISGLNATTFGDSTYTGRPQEPYLYFSGLEKGSDYTTSYANNTNPGTATITATGINNFYGTKKVTFKINKANQYIKSIRTQATYVNEGDTTKVTATSSTGSPVVFRSENSRIATVDNQGNVTGVSEGTVKIYAKAAATSCYNESKEVSTTIQVKPGDKVKAFVKRMYRVTFGREGEEGGVNYWVAELKSGRKTGADVVAEFYISDEMYGKRVSNSKFVDLAYNGIMDRNPDANGKQYWVDGLDSGASYDYVASGFIGSQEFTDLCASYGISRGSRTPSEARDKNIGITGFVNRLYTKALGRGYDVGGLNYWCQVLLDNPSRDNLINVAFDGFYHSEELINQNISNDEYIRRCYRTFMGREAEGAGFNYWKQLLDSGAKTRDDLVRDFAYSQEFSNIMASYGL